MTINSKGLIIIVNSESFEIITNSTWRSHKRQNSRCIYLSVVPAEVGECRHSATHSYPRFLM